MGGDMGDVGGSDEVPPGTESAPGTEADDAPPGTSPDVRVGMAMGPGLEMGALPPLGIQAGDPRSAPPPPPLPPSAEEAAAAGAFIAGIGAPPPIIFMGTVPPPRPPPPGAGMPPADPQSSQFSTEMEAEMEM